MKTAPLWPLERRADGLRQLATMLRSGMDLQQALSTLQREAATPAPLPALTQLQRSGLLRHEEAALLAPMNEAGRLDHGLDWLATRLERERQHRARLRARLSMPVLVLLLAVFIAPLPSLIMGHVGFLGYLLAALRPLLLVVGLVVLAVWLAKALIARWPRPLLGQRARRLRLLSDLLGAGMDAESALRAMAQRASDAEQSLLLACARDSQRGKALAESLARHGLIDASEDFPMLDAAEQSGRLAPGMAHHAGLLEQRFSLRMDTLVEWLPRVFYFLVLALMAWSLLGSGLGGPSAS